jgi:ABC-type cobalamin transport system ATPase subunit
MADGLAQAFRSDQTPSFPEMVASLFRQSNPDQRAGLLNHLIGSIGPAALASVPGLKEVSGGQSVTSQDASQISAEQVQQAAAHAQRQNPSIVDQVSGFYAQHPDVVKALGGAAISIAIQHIVRRR